MEEFRKLLKITKRLLIIESFEDKSEKSIRKGKRNFQGTLHPNIFQILQKYLEVNMEIYASPLYCYFDTCCSAFYDTDRYFGSHGSFLDFDPSEGSFECAPPNSEQVLLKAVQHIVQIITNPNKGPLSFVLFLPDWKDLEATHYLHIHSSLFACNPVKVKLQYIDKKIYGQSNYNINSGTSIMFIIQNQQGKKKWNINHNIENMIGELMVNY